MNWINIETKTLRSPEYIGADPVQRATWLNLLGYCSEQENGGIIAGAKDWKDRRWMQTCGVTLSEVGADSELWAWAGDSLILWNYPVTKEHEVRAKREGGKSGGKASGEARREAMLEASGEAMLEGVLEAELERKGKERKGKEGEKKEKGTDSARASGVNDSDSKPRAKKEDHPNFEEFWENYPKREGKPNALKSWNKEKPDIDDVLNALKWQKRKWADPQFIPLPATYLNQRRFEDEPTKPAAQTSNAQKVGGNGPFSSL
jgi:hypothetical protein